jgi:hypothetical protein
MLESLKKYGSTAIPMHMAIFNIPLNIAVKFEIPLIMWGENSAFEYGGTEDESKGFRLDEKWLRKYGVTHGTKASDWVSKNLSKKELTPYFGPSAKIIEENDIMAVFLGYYFPWDPETSLKIAKAHGFKEAEDGARTGYYDYADIDDDFISIHHYLKWYKFGFTRMFDNLSLEIRNGRISREDAISIIKEKGDDTPLDDIGKFCDFVNITEKQFFEIIEPFRNTDVWENKNDIWMIKDFLIKDWTWK